MPEGAPISPSYLNPRSELARSEARYREIVECLPDGVILQDATGLMLTCNAAAERILGLRPGELVGHVPGDFAWRAVAADGVPLAAADFPHEVALRTRVAVRGFTMGFERADGEFRWLEVDAIPLTVGDRPELDCVVIALSDVTDSRAAREQASFQGTLLDAVGQAVVASDVGGTILYWNRAAEQMYGWTAAEAIGQNVAMLTASTSPAARELGSEIFAELVAGGSWRGDFEVCRKDGSVFVALVIDTPVFGADGKLAAVIGVSTDLTERRRSSEEIRALSAIIESTGDAIISISLDGVICSWNRGAERLYGYGADDVIGRHAAMFLPSPARVERFADVLARVVQGEEVERLERTHLRQGGGLVDVSLTVSPIYGESGTITGISSIIRDTTARRQAERALAHQSLHDALTGLPNRALLEDRLNQVLARARTHHDLVAVLCLGLDGLKLVNEGFGHRAGDDVLVQVAQRLQAALSAQATVARFGGDQFVVVCDVESIEAAERVAARLLEAVETPLVLDDRDLIVTASIGLVLATINATAEALLRDGDVAMYLAKERGRARVERFDDRSRGKAVARLHTTTDLRRALERDELRVFFQPVVSLLDLRPVAVEALLRWEHPERGLVSPGEFIPLAEETGLIVPIGRWVLQEALLQRARWQAELPGHQPLQLAVNLSARQLSDPSLVTDVRSALAECGARPGSLILEITESVLMLDLESVATLRELRDMGVSLHIDDFGTGYSSLAYLKRMPVDALKVDQSFVDGLGANADDLSIVTTVVSLASTLALSVVAEGVETERQLGVLRELGCDFAQGYLFARPLPYGPLLDWLQSPDRRAALEGR